MATKKNKIVELSLGENYVSNWGLWEAIREILQNAQDSEKEGNILKIDYKEADEVLSIKTTGTTLDISSLVLGNSVKGSSDAIGKYGEGYKLALLVLLRLGKPVTIYTGNEKWKPVITESKQFKTNVLAIERESSNNVPKNRIEFIIENISTSEFRRLQVLGIRIGKETGLYVGRTVDCDYGKILLEDKFRGKFYIEGLYIQTDNNFKYGYSFNSDVVDLDRDRKAINYYDLCELTTRSILTQTEDFEIVETSIAKKTHDAKDLQYFYNEATSDFKEGFAEHYLEKHKLDKDTFVGTEKEVVLSDAKKKVVADEITSKWVNEGLGKGAEYREIKEKAKEKNNKEVAYRYYEESVKKELFDWLVYNQKRLSKTQKIKFINSVRKINVSNFSIIEEEVLTDVLTKCNITMSDLTIKE